MNTPLFFVVTIFSILGAANSASLRQATTPAVFLGDSLTSQWKQAGAPVWAEYYTPVGALNVGVAGHKSSDTIKRIESGVIDNLISTKVAVLLVGGNDLKSGVSGATVANNIQTIISMIQDRLPDARVLLLSLIPAGGMPDSLIEQGLIVNERIAQYDDGNKVRFLDMISSFGSILGGPNLELYQADQVHLNVKGYQAWASAMDSLFKELLAQP